MCGKQVNKNLHKNYSQNGQYNVRSDANVTLNASGLHLSLCSNGTPTWGSSYLCDWLDEHALKLPKPSTGVAPPAAAAARNVAPQAAARSAPSGGGPAPIAARPVPVSPAAAAAPAAVARPTPVSPAAAAPVAARPTPVTPVAASAAVAGSMAGTWSNDERKSVDDKKSAFDAAVKEIKSKLGPDWTVVIDWAAIASCGGMSERARRDVGETVIKNVLCRFMSDDFKNFESELFVALNGYCTKKQITITAGKKGGDYEGNRAAVACEPAKVGV